MSTMTLDLPAECAAQETAAPCFECCHTPCLCEAGGALQPLTDPEADHLIDRLASMDEREARIKRQAEALCREIAHQRDGLLFQHGDRLREWTARHLYGKKRSVRRLVGTCGFRTNPGRVVVTDGEAAKDWARVYCPSALRETLDAKALPVEKAADPETGEERVTPPPGCEWVAERESFFVRGNKPTAADAGGDSDE